MDIEYDFTKSLKQLAAESGFNEKVISNHFNRLGYNYSKDRAEYLHKAIVNYKKKHPDATLKEIGDKFDIKSHNTVKKYGSKDYVYEEKSKKKQLNKTGPILSVGNSDHIILHNILKLYLPKERTFSCDLTFGAGGFYKKGIRPPEHKFDKKYYGEKSPKGFVVKSLDEAVNLLPDSSLKSIVIDPPSKVDPSKNDIDSFKTLDEIFPSCEFMINIAGDKLKRNGIMVIKSPDFVLRNDPKATYDGKWVSDYIINYATGDERFELIDKFILVMNQSMITTSCTRKDISPKHAFYFVFRKN